jgi:hypothetical protein
MDFESKFNEAQKELAEARAKLDEFVEDEFVGFWKKNMKLIGIASFAFVIGFALGAALV